MSYFPNNANGQATMANSAPVVVASNQTAIPVTDNSGSFTVDAPVGTPVFVRLSDGGSAISALPITDNSGSITTDTAGDVAHDSADSGNPVKIGGKAATSLPTAVASGDRTNVLTDTFGRPLTAHIDAAMQIWKSGNYTTTQTGTAIWTPTSGKKVVITNIVLGAYGTTAARVILWFGASGDTTYSAGTDQLVAAVSFAPSSTSKPGLVLCPPVPIVGATADYILRITTDAGVSIDVTVYGYEI